MNYVFYHLTQKHSLLRSMDKVSVFLFDKLRILMKKVEKYRTQVKEH